MEAFETSGGLRVKACRHGTMLYNPLDAYVGRALDLYGEFSEGEVQMLLQLAPEGGVVLDVGANIGALTLPLARKVGPKGAVYAVEPQRPIHMMLCANIVMNGLGHVRALDAALGKAKGIAYVPQLDYAKPNNYGGISLMEAPRAGVPAAAAPMTTIDALELEACALMKIDVEGMETEVLQGGADTIRRRRPFLYVENDRPEKSAGLIALLRAELGYDLYWHRPFLYNPANLAGNAANVFPNLVSINMLCVPKEMKRRLNLLGFPEVGEGLPAGGAP
jgi:FkbM family methyltransferase